MIYMKNLKLFIILSIVVIMILFNAFAITIEFMHLNTINLLFTNIINFCFIILISIIDEQNLESFLLFILVWLGSLLIVNSNHMLIIYLGLELQAFSSFILISKNRSSIKGSEAGLKYFILGSISSGIYLLGLYFLFVNSLSLNIGDIILFSDNNLFILGILLVTLSIIFKLALSPLHFWIPDIYEGSSWSVISLISTLPKISILLFLTKIISSNITLIFYCSILSIIIGTIGALNQTKIRRLLAYSGISHMGFMVLGITINNIIGYEVFTIYLVIYMITSILLFVLIFNSNHNLMDYIINLSSLLNRSKIIALTWVLIFLSMAGLPPLIGFVSKWFVIWNIINFNYTYTSIILIVFSILGIVYYLRISQIIYFQKNSSYITWSNLLGKHSDYKNHNLILLGIGFFFILTFIINPDPLILIINYSFII